jgi:hypothetical protein
MRRAGTVITGQLPMSVAENVSRFPLLPPCTLRCASLYVEDQPLCNDSGCVPMAKK